MQGPATVLQWLVFFAAGRALTGKLLYEIEFTRIGLIFPYGSDKI